MEEDACPVCLEDFGERKDGSPPLVRVYTECGHMFCRNCIVQALKIKPLCPLCRSYQKSLVGSKTKPAVPLQAQTPPPDIKAEGWNVEAVRTAIFGEKDEQGYRRVLLTRTDGKKGVEE